MPPVLFLALLAAQRKAARFAFLAAVPCGSLPLHGLLLALGGQRLPGQQLHVFFGHGHPGVIQQELLLLFELFRVQRGLPHRVQRGLAAGSRRRVEGLCAKHMAS